MNLILAAAAFGAAIALFMWFRRRIVVEFGLLRHDPAAGDVVSVRTRSIPFRPDDVHFSFGLRFFSPSGRTFRARVVHFLPAKPELAGGDVDGEMAYLPDGRVRLEGKELAYAGGGVRRLRFSAGDPLGAYEIELHINGSLRKRIHYEVVPHAS